MSSLKQKRWVKTFEQTINAEAKTIFPLLCPTREYDWIDGWSCVLHYSESGFAEENCIFETKFDNFGKAHWIVTTYQPDRKIGFAIYFEAGIYEKLDIVLNQSAESTKVIWTRTYTLINPVSLTKLNLILNSIEKRMPIVMESLNHYINTGDMLKMEVH